LNEALAGDTSAGRVAESFEAWMAQMLERFERSALRVLPAADIDPCRLHQAMRYAVLDGGKRVRPLLAYAAGEASGAPLPALERIALAVEYVHAYSLVHDDLPCMDNDVLRRGKPTVHVAYGEATAMLAGDALQAEAFRVLAEADLPPQRVVEIVRELARASGTGGMCGGQALDLDAVGRLLSLAELERMHRMKTGALLHASVLMGALAGTPTPALLAALRAYAQAIGFAFQIVDDILDVAATSDVLGKTAGKDAAQGKPTVVSALGLEAARAWAEQLRLAAHEALGRAASAAGSIPESAAAPGACAPDVTRLRQLADLIVLRSH